MRWPLVQKYQARSLGYEATYQVCKVSSLLIKYLCKDLAIYIAL